MSFASFRSFPAFRHLEIHGYHVAFDTDTMRLASSLSGVLTAGTRIMFA